MDWRERVAEGLPAPRNDEPASLRQDILDGLADHLDCALKRELTKNITPDEAVENVKRRFGNPRDLARRLWLDAMKDTIMSKRLTLVAMGLMFVMCLLLGWMAWTSQRASQEAAASIRQTNGELLKQLTTLLARPPGPSHASERVPVRFHLICDDTQKSPARGFEGTLTVSKSGSLVNALQGISDANGELDFGMLPLGSYSITLTTPWHETTRFDFDASPGFPISSPIMCPPHDWLPADVSFKLIGLPSLKDRDALICCHLWAPLNRPVGQRDWRRRHPNDSGGRHLGSEEFEVVFDPSGRIVYFDKATPEMRRFEGPKTRYALFPQIGRSFQLLAPTTQFSWLAEGLKRPTKLSFLDREYSLVWIAVLLAPDVRRLAGEHIDENKLPYTMLTWDSGWTPFAESGVVNVANEPVSLTLVASRKNVFEVHLSSDIVDRVDKMLLASASRVPEPANGAETDAESTAGVELLKTLGIGGAVPVRTSDGLIGLRLNSVRDALPAKQTGLQDGDLLLGVDGWNVKNDRELGWASRRYHPELRPPQNQASGDRSRAPLNALLVLVRRGAQTLLCEIPPPGSPSPDSAAPSKGTPPAKASAEGAFPLSRRGRRPVPVPDPIPD
jgi:hypothetical protein